MKKNDDLQDFRCRCGKLLMRVSADMSGFIEVVCWKCKLMTRKSYGLATLKDGRIIVEAGDQRKSAFHSH